ncbi:MAG TPA: copper-binding protein [Gammaproteobacteria bacterium]|nr:copper-binding protein [Gammaproteobacteria bacterium]
MKTTTFALGVLMLAGLSLSACGQSGEKGAPAQGAAMSNMPGMTKAGDKAAEHMGQGTVNAVDAAAGTVNISHGAVASAKWPAMTMSFRLANPGVAKDIKPGDRVDFQFTIQSGMDATVTSMSAAK